MNSLNYHSFFTRAMKGNNAWWAFLLGVFIIMIGAMIGQLPLTGYAMMMAKKMFPDDSMDRIEEFSRTADWDIVGADPNIGLILLLLSFGGGVIGLIFAMRLVHNRSFSTLINPIGRINLSKVAFGFFAWLILSLGSEVISYVLNPGDYIFHFQPVPFLILLLICLIFLPIQTSFEELFIRGYLMQALGFLFKNPLPAILLSSLFFASLHMMNPEVAKFGIGNMIFYYSLAGIVLAIVTVMDDSLELALGIHYATNLSGALFVTYEGAALKTPALFSMTNTDVQVTSIGFIIMAVIFLAICWKSFNWRSFSYLFSKITFNDEITPA